jgi:uncharacterized membrane protein YgdD (TMEM256/DUF423 family)
VTARLSRLLIAIAALIMAGGVGLGAYASHGLGSLDAASVHAFETAVQYQLIHGVALIGIAIYGERHPAQRGLAVAAILMLAGTVLFCGGVYSSSLDGPRWISQVAPMGGVTLIVAWAVLAVVAGRQMIGRGR